MYSNGLTDAGLERLALLMEECGEVIQAIGKIQRHGYTNDWLTSRHRPSNRQQLEEEIGHFWYAILLLLDAGDLSMAEIERHAEEKEKTVRQYLHHQNLEITHD